MNWLIERDKEGLPVRLWWAGEAGKEAERVRIAEEQEKRAGETAKTFMPSVRKWAKERGLL